MCKQDCHLALNNAVEVVGKVQQDLSIRVFQATDFGTGIGRLFDGDARSLERYTDMVPRDRLQGC